MNYFTFVKNNWARLGLANYKAGVSSTKMKEAFKKSKGTVDTSEKQLSKRFSAADNKHFQRGVKTVKEAIEKDLKTGNADMYKNMDDMWDKLVNNKPNLPTKSEATRSRKLRETQLQERAKPQIEDEGKARREAEMAEKTRLHREFVEKERKKVAARKMKAFLPFDIEDYDLPKLRKALILFISNVENLPQGASIKIKGKNKFLKATADQVYEYMERMKIQESDIKPFYNSLVKPKKENKKDKDIHALIQTADDKLTFRSFKGKTGISIVADAINRYNKQRGKREENLSGVVVKKNLKQMEEYINKHKIPLPKLKHFYNIIANERNARNKQYNAREEKRKNI